MLAIYTSSIASEGSPALGLNESSSGGPTFNTRDLALIFMSDENLLIIVLYFPNYLIKLFHTKANRQVKNSQRLVHITVTIPQTNANEFPIGYQRLATH